MKNPILDQIKTQVVAVLYQKYGYCGCADSDHFALLNSGPGEENFTVTIRDENAILAAKASAAKANPPT